METCAFCDGTADYGFDMEWDAFLCYRCYSAQRLMLFMLFYKVSRRFWWMLES